MTPEQAAHDTAAIVVRTPAGFMTDPATFTRGAALGFEGMDFYVAGRGGALGDVPADVVTAAFWVFAADAIRAAWERSCDRAAATRCGIRMAEVRPPVGGGALRRRARLRACGHVARPGRGRRGRGRRAGVRRGAHVPRTRPAGSRSCSTA